MARGGGGKLNKSETVQVRFDPILKLAADLAAAQDRRTLSSFTEMAVDRMVRQVQVARDDDGNPVNAYQVANECWHTDSRVSLQILSDRYPDLLTLRERKLIQGRRYAAMVLEECGVRGQVDQDMLLWVQGWKDLCAFADDQLTLEELVKRIRALTP